MTTLEHKLHSGKTTAQEFKIKCCDMCESGGISISGRKQERQNQICYFSTTSLGHRFTICSQHDLEHWLTSSIMGGLECHLNSCGTCPQEHFLMMVRFMSQTVISVVATHLIQSEGSFVCRTFALECSLVVVECTLQRASLVVHTYAPKHSKCGGTTHEIEFKLSHCRMLLSKISLGQMCVHSAIVRTVLPIACSVIVACVHYNMHLGEAK